MFRLHTRTESLVGLLASVTATVAVLGSAVLLFSEAGKTPWFETGTALATEASECRHVTGSQARHQCLRDVAAASAPRAASDAAVAARGSFDSTAP